MANINRVWKRWMATGCLHSTHACKEYIRNVRAFKAAFQPARHVHFAFATLAGFRLFRTTG